MNLKLLAKDTAVYGLSSIVGRFLNYLLVPLYTTKIPASCGGYGTVTNLYAYTALLLALLTFGMETTLFRFSSKEGEDPDRVYGTTLRLVGGVALLFAVIVLAALAPIASALGYADHPWYVGCMALIVAMDAFQAIMFSRLRQMGKAVKFMLCKFAFIIPNILLNLFVFLLLPRFYQAPDGGVGFIFLVNLVCTASVFLYFIPELKGLGYGFDKALAGRMLRYTWPLLLLSLVGILNQVADKILYPWLVPGPEGKVQLGIYGACVKIAMILALLTQAFRYAYEPVVFGSSRSKDSPQTLVDGMKYFIIFSLLAYLAVMFYLPLLKYFVGSSYWEGLKVVPVVMAAEICMGVYFNLSFWYKLSDQTFWGAVLSGAGALVMIALNVLLVPRIGYMGCAWAGLAGYGCAMLLSYAIGAKKYPIPYDLRSALFFLLLTAALLGASHVFALAGLGTVPLLAVNTVLLGIYGLFVYRSLKTKMI